MPDAVGATLIGSFTPGSPEWHAARRDGLGGSEVAAVLGLSPFESKFSLWHRKRGEIGPANLTGPMEWGHRLEPVVLGKFFEEHPELRRYIANGTFTNDARPWQVANPDAIALGDAGHRNVVEIKTARDDTHWGKAGTDDIPVYYRCQVQWYMDCLGIDTAYLAVLIGGSDYREYVIPYSPDDAHVLRGHCAAFIRSLRHGIRPDIDGSSATYSTVKALPEGVVDETVYIDESLAHRYREAVADHSAAEKWKRECTSRLLDLIGDRKHVATDDGVRVATRTVTKDGRTHSLRPAKDPK